MARESKTISTREPTRAASTSRWVAVQRDRGQLGHRAASDHKNAFAQNRPGSAMPGTAAEEALDGGLAVRSGHGGGKTSSTT